MKKIDLKRLSDKELIEVGIKNIDELSAAHDLFYKLSNANPDDDVAVIHKLVYEETKAKWQEKHGGEKPTQEKGLVYNPIVRGQHVHTMPLNFAWLASAAKTRVPYEIVSPITYRVLIRVPKLDMSKVYGSPR